MRTRTFSSKRPSRGLMVLDVVWGIVLATALLMALTVAVVKQDKAQLQRARARAASRAAEDALLALQAHQPLPPGATVEHLADAAPAGHTWIRVHVTTDGRPASLVGLITSEPGARK